MELRTHRFQVILVNLLPDRVKLRCEQERSDAKSDSRILRHCVAEISLNRNRKAFRYPWHAKSSVTQNTFQCRTCTQPNW